MQPQFHLLSLVFLVAPLVATSFLAAPTANLFTNSPLQPLSDFHVPSIHESAVQARRILQLQSIATLSTIFPPSPQQSVSENRPKDVANTAIGLMEYYASCGPEAFNPTILGVTIATTMKNAAAGSNVTLSLRYHIPSNPPPPPDPWAYLPANLPRFSLTGHLERLSNDEVHENNISACFLQTHPEGSIWAPGTDIHESWWAKLVVQEVYFFGGFGDRARIGWIPINVWRSITEAEVDKYRLVGEEGYESKVHVASQNDFQLPL